MTGGPRNDRRQSAASHPRVGGLLLRLVAEPQSTGAWSSGADGERVVADRLDALIRNPCQIKGAGHVRSPERRVAEESQVLAVVEAVPERYRLALLLASWCALRRGEVLGLQRADIDVASAEMHVRRAWSAPMGKAPALGPPKTEKGVRPVIIPSNIVPALISHLERFVGPEPHAWLFATQNGSPLSPRNLDRVWSKAREGTDLRQLRLHDLRHSGLTWAADTGASTANLMQRGGHSDPRAALRYQHATSEQDHAIADALAARATVPVLSLVPRDEGIHNTRRRSRKPL